MDDKNRLFVPAKLRSELLNLFGDQKDRVGLNVNVLSFGFKHGTPEDVDYMFDTRFLPNPFYLDELKHLTGNDKPVQDYVMSFQESEDFMAKLVDMVRFLIPNYVKEGKYRLLVEAKL